MPISSAQTHRLPLQLEIHPNLEPETLNLSTPTLNLNPPPPRFPLSGHLKVHSKVLAPALGTHLPRGVAARCGWGYTFGGLNNYLYFCFGVPDYNYSGMYPPNPILIIKAPNVLPELEIHLWRLCSGFTLLVVK